MKTSEAWKEIAIAFLKRAAKVERTQAEINMTKDGLCHARWSVTLTHEQYDEMSDDIHEAIEARKLAENEEDLAYVVEGRGVYASNFRGTLALLFAADNASRERLVERSAVLAGLL